MQKALKIAALSPHMVPPSSAACVLLAVSAGHRLSQQLQLFGCSYQPVHVLEGVAHPDHVVETSSLANVQPPEIRFNHNLKVSSLCLAVVHNSSRCS